MTDILLALIKYSFLPFNAGFSIDLIPPNPLRGSNGFSETRTSHEITYVTFVEFIDERNSQAGKFKTLAMTLRAAVQPPRTLVEVDARMAADVTEIIRRVIVDEII